MTTQNTMDKRRRRIRLEFGGGVEALFDGKRECWAEFGGEEEKDKDPNPNTTIRALLRWLIREGPLKGSDRAEMLVQRDTVRPGVLVLVNDTDWEILGGLDAQLSDGDTVTFISTLHGG